MAITYRLSNETRLSVEQMDNNFHYVEDQISGITSSIITLNTGLASTTASIATLNTNLASATASIVTLNTNLASATASIATLNTNLASTTASIATLNTNLASATASIDTLTSGLASATASIDTLNTNLASATASIDTLTPKYKVYTARVEMSDGSATVYQNTLGATVSWATFSGQITTGIIGALIGQNNVYVQVSSRTTTSSPKIVSGEFNPSPWVVTIKQTDDGGTADSTQSVFLEIRVYN